MFLGDSLSNQQGDSLLGMLGWHPDWMTAGAPRNEKLVGDWLSATLDRGFSLTTLLLSWCLALVVVHR